MNLISSIVVNRPRNMVWDLMNDARLFPLWQKGYESTVQIKGSPGEEGAQAQHVYKENGKEFMFTEEVLESMPPSRIKVLLESNVMSYEVETELKESSGGTEITMTNHAVMKAFSFRILSPLLRKSFQKRQDEDLVRLKKLAESQATDK